MLKDKPDDIVIHISKRFNQWLKVVKEIFKMPVRTTVVFLFMILRKGKSNIETPLLSAKKGWKNYRQQEEISFIK